MEPVWAFAAWLAVGVAPGYALVRLLAPGLPRSLAAALAPAATWGVLAPLVPILSATETAIPAWAPWAWAVAGLAAATLVEWTRRTTPLSVEGLRASERWALALGVALAAGIWLGAVRDWTFAPGDDAVNHALFAARILADGIVAPTAVTSPDPLDGISGVAYYPLTLHVIGAWTASIAGWPIAGAVPAAAIMTAIWTLPLGLLWLCRALLPGVPRAALLAPVAASCLATFPWGPVAFGGYPLIASASALPTMAASFLVVAADADRGRGRVGALAVVGACVAGVVAGHTSTLALLAVVGLALGWWPPPIGVNRRSLLRDGLVCAVFALILVAPTAAGVWAGSEERLGMEGAQRIGWLEAALGAGLGANALVWPAAASAVLVFVGLVCAIRGVARGWGVALLLLWGLEIAVGVAPDSWASTAASPWYSLPLRVALHAGLFALPLLALGAAASWTWLEGGLRSRAGTVWVPRVVSVGTALGLVVWGASASLRLLDRSVSRTARTGAADEAAWDYIAGRLKPGERVLNDLRDGSPYLEATRGIPVVFGVRTSAWDASAWAQRRALLTGAERLGRDDEVDSIAANLSVRYVLRGDDGRTGAIGCRLPGQDLASAPALRLAFAQDGVEVYEVLAPGGGVASPWR